ncbi:MAG TPA: hypothetical protein VHW44_17645 [Pseudonocardiaceae bacterium]|jgi:hypothetical protein|nr:hypothetical protein [Pseudonocardiaceae bacterium]
MAQQNNGAPVRGSRSIFREQAVEYHRGGRWAEVLPPAARPRMIRVLWAALAALGLLVVALAAVPTPTYGAGTAVAVTGAAAGLPGDSVALVVALPAASPAALTDGADAVLTQGGVRGQVVGHEPTGLSPAQLATRFGLPPSATGGLPGPAAVAVVRVEVGGGSVQVGSRYPAVVRTGSHRFLASVPGLGRLFPDDHG